MNAEDQELLARYLDDVLTDDEAARLRTLLENSAEARRMLRDLATVDAKLTELAAGAFDGPAILSPLALPDTKPTVAPSSPGVGYGWRVACGIAAGLVVGVISSSMAWAYGMPRWLEVSPAPVYLVEESFEHDPAPLSGGVPTLPAVWSGDFSRVTGPREGIAPAEGTRMLEILRSDYEGKPTPDGSYCGDVFRLVDLRPYKDRLADGSFVVNFAAAFNSLPFPEGEVYSVAICVNALTADMATSPSELLSAAREHSLAMSRTCCPRIDRDPKTWEGLVTEMRVPPESELLLVQLSVLHGLPGQRRVELGGHFVDSVRVWLVHKPDRR
jgi:hypothetical protein